MQPQKSGRTIQSVQRAIDIINCFEDNKSELTLGQISAALDLNKSTVHGILNTLYQNDFVRQNSSGRYMLGGYFARRFGPADASIRNLLKETALDGMDADTLADILIVSQVEVQKSDMNVLKVDVEPAAGQKCERCWKVLPTVGADSKHPTLCPRCARVVSKSVSFEAL